MSITQRLLHDAKKYRLLLSLAVFGLLAVTSAQLIAPAILASVIDAVSTTHISVREIALKAGFILLFLYLLQFGGTFLRGYYAHRAAWFFVSDIRTRAYEHLQTLSIGYYHDKQTGQLLSRITADTSILEVFIAHALPDLVVNVVVLGGVICILIAINPILALASLAPFPIIAVSVYFFVTRIRPLFKKGQKAMGDLTAELHDAISGMKEIHVYNRQKDELHKINALSKGHALTVLGALKVTALYHPAMQFCTQVGNVAVIIWGGYLASLNKLPVGDIVSFVLYLGMLYQPVSVLGRVFEDIQMALAGAERVYEIIDTPTVVQEPCCPVDVANVQGDIVFSHVDFSYTDGTKVLDDVSFHIKSGQTVALVGQTGMGKTTIANLLCRFYDPQCGTILIDDIDIKTLSLASLRNQISVVLQDVFLFNASIANNIAYGKADASFEEIMRAAGASHADEFICDMPEGYETVIGERGIKLSGGQKQRLSIARAILRNSPILILDEATASVDMETERLIYQALDRASYRDDGKKRTTIIIAHRLASVKKADCIYVIGNGCVQEKGTHEELLAKGGLYARLASTMV